MATYKIDKLIVLNACVKYLQDEKNKDENSWYIDREVVQRLYDVLKSKAYNFVTSVDLDDHEVDFLSEYFDEV
ncbi:hypothetical protein Barba22A_gp075 [Rheinheimera phage vB_RspM_Barba22A]|jgi:hypothetical protein|uniref:Uncharacterized protein n=83 Tax=Barbavirus TaxID=2733095 RepID=A0A7G9VRV6_9CAUD|nr:hypothetical protein HOV44_gp083 [Rheinheimera phage Barba5S]YP_009822815.1 hypothetical protein HOV45_gp079 [Rheinheimera phage Barba8S]YP_009822952.1 hypothetical protein HOV46_gp075 [Rheinheimera phage vB_RspM_Barba18A]YP_009823233.1 hypothetical protein HOV48_gp077 [Rheinheimera phage Barba21A]QCQ57926.1 hypothetical protein Barba1A_gp075 [Rheinheimera phage vB_RspM_Barba1A]QCQ58062.1 hypothetical protein Barba1S_gp075 [Rheinheimera phage vB_RspM_Barba1S]QCQ58198.1 hypothetical protein